MQISSDDPLSWRGTPAPSLAEIEALAADAYARLPEHFRGLCDNLVIQVADFPTEEVLDVMNLETEFDLLGLFQGVGLPFQSASVPEQLPNMVWLYRRPILDYWAEHEDSLGAIVTHVLVHEIGHHFGLVGRGHRSDRGERRLKGATTMRLDGRCHCGYFSFEAEARSAECVDLPLHRLPDRHRLGLPHQHPHARQEFQNAERRADPLRQDHGGNRQPRGCRRSARNAARRSIRQSPGDNPDSYMVRVGTLRQRDQLTPKQQNWFRSAQPWVTELASVPKNDKGRPSKPPA